MELYCVMTLDKYRLKDGTKAAYELIESEEMHLTEQQYNSIVEASPFFKRLGGSEYHHKTYTCKGYLTYKLVSKSPNRQIKSVRTFNFNI